MESYSLDGDYFKVNDTSKDEARSKWVDWFLQKIFGKDGYYHFWGNVTGLFLGYTAPAIGCAYFIGNWWFSIAGFLVALTYGSMGKIFPNKCYTKYAEYMSGFLVFALLTICILYE